MGKIEGKIELARNLLQLGVGLSEIAKAADISEEKLRELLL